MPYIQLKTTKKLSDDTCAALKAAFGKAIENFPGKTESWLMVNIEDNKKMWFRGDDSADSAMVDVELLGAVSADGSRRMTAELCKLLHEMLGVAPERVYVKYSGYEHWGWNGGNF